MSVVPKLVRAVTQIKVSFMSYYPQYIALTAHNIEQPCGFGSALPPKKSHIISGGNLPPVSEPLVYVNKRSSALSASVAAVISRTAAPVQSSSYSRAVLFHCEENLVLSG